MFVPFNALRAKISSLSITTTPARFLSAIHPLSIAPLQQVEVVIRVD